MSESLTRIVRHLRQVLADGTFFFCMITIAVWLLSRPFEGVDGDARIYMARALADLDPAGVGRDMMFVLDGQSQFSIFSYLADRLVAAFNPSGATLVFAILNVICWLTAAQFFIGRFAEGRMKWAILLIVAALPAGYGPFHMLRFGEQYAIPRPLAEACVLAALGFLIDGRRWLAGLCLGLATAFHPIMALPGILIFGIDLCRADRRWIGAGLGIGSMSLAAAFCGLPIVDRLTTLIDHEWLALLQVRNPYLFPALWPVEPFGFLTLQLATIILALNLVAPRVRFICLAIAGVAICGIALASVFGDLWPVLLVVQAQLWRMTWLMGVIAAMSLALCLLNMRKRNTHFELASALLVFGWLFSDVPLLVIAAAGLALFIDRFGSKIFAVSRFVMNSMWVLILAVGILSKCPALFAFLHYAINKPETYHARFGLLWGIFIVSIPIVAFAVVWALRKDWFPAKAMAPLAAGALLCAFFFWDDRQPDRKWIDRAEHPRDLAALFPQDHSEIYWMGGTQPWYLLGHPSWALRIQGAGIVFSRPLAMLWQERIKFLMALDVMDGNELGPWTIPPRDSSTHFTLDQIGHICGRSDAPSTIVIPLDDRTSVPAELKYKTWQPAPPEVSISEKANVVTWHRIENIIISCADYRPEADRRAK